MTWVNLPIPSDESPLSRAERSVLRLANGDTCRVRTDTGEEVEATIDAKHGVAFRDEDGEALDVVAVWVAPTGGPSGRSGASLTEDARAERGLGRLNLRISQAAINKLDRDAKNARCSRAKFVETLILGR